MSFRISFLTVAVLAYKFSTKYVHITRLHIRFQIALIKIKQKECHTFINSTLIERGGEIFTLGNPNLKVLTNATQIYALLLHYRLMRSSGPSSSSP